MKLIEIIKKNIIAAVAVAMVVGFSAFKIAQELDPPQNGWYALHYIDPDLQDLEDRNDPSNLAIGNRISNIAPTGSCDQANAEQEPCAVGMTFASTLTKPTTLQAAQLDASVTVDPDLAFYEED